MSEFHHATNIRVPFDRHDLGLLSVLLDYRLGVPIPPPIETAYTMEQLKSQGFIGLYIAEDAYDDPFFVKFTGWGKPEKLGAEWMP